MEIEFTIIMDRAVTRRFVLLANFLVLFHFG